MYPLEAKKVNQLANPVTHNNNTIDLGCLANKLSRNLLKVKGENGFGALLASPFSCSCDTTVYIVYILLFCGFCALLIALVDFFFFSSFQPQ